MIYVHKMDIELGHLAVTVVNFIKIQCTSFVVIVYKGKCDCFSYLMKFCMGLTMALAAASRAKVVIKQQTIKEPLSQALG